jgi:hypothetical protein
VQIVDNKALVFETNEPDIITHVIPNSAAIEDNKVAVKWGLHEVQILLA